VAYSGGGRLRPPPPPWSHREFLDFFTVFVSFVSRLNRKIRVPRLLVTVRVFCILKTASKYIQSYYYFGDFGDKNDFLEGV